MKDRHIGAAWEIDHHGVIVTGLGVIARERMAQASGLHPYDRIALRIEIATTVQRFDRDCVGLYGIALASKGRLDDEPKKACQAQRAAKRLARANTLKLPVDIFSADRFLRRLHFCGPRRGGRKRVPIDHPQTYRNCHIKPGKNASTPASNGYNSVMILPRNLLLWCAILHKGGMWISC